MTIDKIIKVCDFIAGIPSRGLEQLAEEFAPLPQEQINKRDPYNADNTFLGFRARPLQRRKPSVTEWLTDEGLQKLEEYARQGFKQSYIANQIIGVDKAIFSKWKSTHPEIAESLSRGYEKAK